ncbi:MAG: HEAT repeat domain-containing protein [Clostridiales bacterium]|nr:HEAT repeat domain-containing protein [Clostridiales bacterium]
MKKILAFILAVGMVFSLAACGGENTGKETETKQETKKIDYANMTEDDLIKEFIKDEQNITLDEFIDLASTYSYATINNKLELDENITDKAIKKLKENKAKLPAAKEFVEPLLKSDAPQVRGYAFSNIATFFGASDSHKASAKEILKTEKEPYVIKCAVKALGNEGGKDAEIGKFLLDAAKNENSVVRRQAAVALGSTWNKTLNGAVDAEIELMKDSDKEVRKAAYEYAGLLGDDRVVAPISEMLKNEADADLHSSGVKGLVWLWYDYPSHENTSEAAYRATIDYLKTTPGSDKVPAWAAVTSFTNKSEKNYAAWKEKATYFNTDELYEVMLGIAKNENLSRLARGYACKPVAAHCSKEQFEAFGTVVNALADKDAKFIQDEYQNQSKKLE